MKESSYIDLSSYRLILLFLVGCTQFTVHAQTRIEIPTDSQWTITLIGELEILGDEYRQWSAESLFAASDDLFGPNPVDVKPKLHNYWGRFEVVNTTKSEKWLSFESYYWDYVTLYFRNPAGNITKVPFGIMSNEFDNKIRIEPQTEYEVLANFESSGKFRREDNINLVIQPTIPTLEGYRFSAYIDGIVFGIMFGLAMYNLFLFFALRDTTYFWYTVYIFSFASSFLTLFTSTQPIATQIFFSDFPTLAFYIKKFSDPLIWIAYTNFVRSFLSTKERHPIWNRALDVSIALILLQFIINFTGLYHFSGIARITLWNLVVLACVGLAFFSYIKGHTKVRFFILGQFFLLSGISITYMYYAGLLDVFFLLPDNEFFNYFRAPTSIFAFGAIEAIVFSFALADKYNQLQRDVASIRVEKEREKSEALRLHELDTFKNNFYANITHEFRTPLTVIDGIAGELADRLDNVPQKGLSLIRKNSKSLLRLVNQMLDLSKLQAGKETLDLQQSGIIFFLRYIVETNESFANLKNIGLQFYSEEEELIMDFDAKKVELVLRNLISNAVKFTPPYGRVLVVAKKTQQSDQDFLQILVKDTGIGISKEQIPSIFDRFYQASTAHESGGTGIGLALVKELVAVMGASITVESEVEQGTTFTLLFPVQNRAPLLSKTGGYLWEPIVHVEDVLAEEEYSNDELPILLIIEDNADLVYYLQICLKDQYQILISNNGRKGVERAFESLPDIIISDVMMPVMDGFEVCATLKEDIRTSHIPIILLTARAAPEDKITGLTHGADAYLIKPFEKAELIVRLNNLLEIRSALQKKYSSGLIAGQPPLKVPEWKEDTFIEKTEKIILSRLEDESFSIHDLTHELHLSRSQVHRKIKALTDMSPAIYIRHIRLQKAKVLLASTELSISEIAYRVGFKTPVYFSQVFKSTFGESPNATRK